MSAVATAPQFIADDLALDFLNSEFGTGAERADFLGDDAQVLAWLKLAGVMGAAQALPPGRRGALCQAAVALRANAREMLAARKSRRSADPAVLNRVLARGSGFQSLQWHKGRPPSLLAHRPIAAVDDLLVPVAEAIAQLLATADLDLVRKCDNPECTLWFHDRTKSHQRRWCSMAVCGNRMKAAAFRQRNKA